MNIHHATMKKAEKLNITLDVVETEHGDMARATDNGKEFYTLDPKQSLEAVLLTREFVAEYPALTIDFVSEEKAFRLHCRTDEEIVTFWVLGHVPALADVIDMVQFYADENNIDLDPEAGYEEEKSYRVVPQRYKDEYKARGNVNHCGDELAEFLDGKFINTSAKFDLDAFLIFCSVNNTLPSDKLVAMIEAANRGYVGRARMNMRQKLEKEVARIGSVVYEERTHKFSEEFLLGLLNKHPNVEAEWEA